MAMNSEPPTVLDLPVGLSASGDRTESDSMGEIAVPADRYWGAQTQRSLLHFSIGHDRMPVGVARALGHVKRAAAIVNGRDGRLPDWMSTLIVRVADEVIAGELDDHFPLFVWQTGSGTQTNMNVNEVISNRAIQLVGGMLGSKKPVHPNDHVNMGHSSNDAFPTAMHIATMIEIETGLLPPVRALAAAVEARSREWADVVKIGRTHLQDAVPLTVGQEWSGFGAQLAGAIDHVERSRRGLYELALGGTAVGTGLNAPPGFADDTAAEIAAATGHPFVSAPNKFAALAGIDAMVEAMSAIRALAVVLMKVANDIRWLASGPRAGLGELRLPANEPGSSIMPGKVNPTQCEAMVMVCLQVLGADGVVASAGAQGNFQLNTMRPLVIHNVLNAARLLGDASDRLHRYCIEGLELDEERIAAYVDRSLMLVTALSPVIGYDRAASIAHRALEEDLSLREAALESGWVDATTYDRVIDPGSMVDGGS
ncbi:MAG: fumarate hydratase, class [Acidimicrobiaceae bacterium]|nr:fumarate hydratase, class [Acidimicrobiaceae bacterium]